jgi:hypothetical protein
MDSDDDFSVLNAAAAATGIIIKRRRRRRQQQRRNLWMKPWLTKRANVFRVLHTPILLSPRKAEKVVLVICALHNFLCARAKSEYLSACLESAITAEDSLTQLQPSNGGNATNAHSEHFSLGKVVSVGRILMSTHSSMPDFV